MSEFKENNKNLNAGLKIKNINKYKLLSWTVLIAKIKNNETRLKRIIDAFQEFIFKEIYFVIIPKPRSDLQS